MLDNIKQGFIHVLTTVTALIAFLFSFILGIIEFVAPVVVLYLIYVFFFG